MEGNFLNASDYCSCSGVHAPHGQAQWFNVQYRLQRLLQFFKKWLYTHRQPPHSRGHDEGLHPSGHRVASRSKHHHRLATRRADSDRTAINSQGCCFRRSVLSSRPVTTAHLADEWRGTRRGMVQFPEIEEVLGGCQHSWPRAMHDANRVLRNGKGSFELVMKGLHSVRRAGVEYNILCTVHRENLHHGRGGYRLFCDQLDATVVQFIPSLNAPLHKPSVLPTAAGASKRVIREFSTPRTDP